MAQVPGSRPYRKIHTARDQFKPAPHQAVGPKEAGEGFPPNFGGKNPFFWGGVLTGGGKKGGAQKEKAPGGAPGGF